MKLIRVRVLKAHDYAQKPRAKDEEYDCEERFVEVLRVMGNIEVVQEPKRTYKRRDLRAES